MSTTIGAYGKGGLSNTPEETMYLDEEGRETTPDKAVRRMTRIFDEEGNFIREEWQIAPFEDEEAEEEAEE